MINLIPNEEKKKMANNFYFRLVTLSFLMLSFATSFAVLAILPSYFLSMSKEKFANEKLSVQNNEPVPALDQKTQDAIQRLDHQLNLVENMRGDKFVVSEKVIKEIIKSKLFNIKITSISYDVFDAGDKKISINGTAPSREQLLLFRQSLEDNPAFKNVDLPISNFVKGSNIEFQLSLAPA